jgi:hypothetical protein
MSNPQSELFKELSTNETFKTYLDQLNTTDENTVLINALNDTDLMQKLTNIIDDLDIIKLKMQIKINQVNKNKKVTDIKEYPYEDNNTLYLSTDIKIEKNGLIYKIVTSDYVMNY